MNYRKNDSETNQFFPFRKLYIGISMAQKCQNTLINNSRLRLFLDVRRIVYQITETYIKYQEALEQRASYVVYSSLEFHVLVKNQDEHNIPCKLFKTDLTLKHLVKLAANYANFFLLISQPYFALCCLFALVNQI